jgi:hypothetical protein
MCGTCPDCIDRVPPCTGTDIKYACTGDNRGNRMPDGSTLLDVGSAECVMRLSAKAIPCAIPPVIDGLLESATNESPT